MSLNLALGKRYNALLVIRQSAKCVDMIVQAKRYITDKLVRIICPQMASHLTSKNRYGLASIAILCPAVFSQSTSQVHDNVAPRENHRTS